MADSSTRANAHSKEILTHLQSLSLERKQKIFNLIALMLTKKAGSDTKTLLIIKRNQKQIYAGNSVDIATTLYIGLLDQAIHCFKMKKKIRIEFYTIDKHDNQTDLGGVQS